MTPTNANIWSYFLLLEEDIFQISKYIDFSAPNFPTFSNSNTKAMLSICSEIDVLMKEYCQLLDPSKKHGNIEDYRTCISAKNPKFVTIQVEMPRFGLDFVPWKEIPNTGTPIKWWKDHNSVKHDRIKNYHLATLENVVESGAGLFSLVVGVIKASEEKASGKSIDYRDITFDLLPESKIYRFSDSSFYYNKIKMWLD